MISSWASPNIDSDSGIGLQQENYSKILTDLPLFGQESIHKWWISNFCHWYNDKKCWISQFSQVNFGKSSPTPGGFPCPHQHQAKS
jgi:hypothetical protein